MVMSIIRPALIVAVPLVGIRPGQAEDLGAMWGTAEKEAEYYRIVDIPIPAEVPMHPGSFEALPDGRLAVGTRRGDVYFISGAFEEDPQPTYELFASGQASLYKPLFHRHHQPSSKSAKNY